MMKYAVIVAGGSGARMNNQVPKQFLQIKGKPVLYYAIDTFLKSYKDLEIILVLPEEHIGIGQEIIDAWFDGSRVKVTMGGRTRFHSVQNGLKLVEKESIVFVHDGVRCLVSKELVKRCYSAAIEFGSAIPVVDCKDSVRLETDDENEAINRNRVKLYNTNLKHELKARITRIKVSGIQYLVSST